jgi:hypothetical protein
MELSGHFDYFTLTFAKLDFTSLESTCICVESLVQIGLFLPLTLDLGRI